MTVAAAIPVVPPATPTVDPAAVAAAMDPARVAAHIPPPPPSTPAVEIAQSLFNWLDSASFAVAMIILFILVARLLQAWMLHRSINKSIDTKSEHAASLIDKVNKPLENASSSELPGDDRNGLVLVAIGVAMAGFGVIQGDEETIRIACGAALFPLLVGAALLIRRQLVKREMEKERAAERG